MELHVVPFSPWKQARPSQPPIVVCGHSPCPCCEPNVLLLLGGWAPPAGPGPQQLSRACHVQWGAQTIWGRGEVWVVPLTGSPPVPQLMRMVLHESLKALKTRGWDERSVPQSGLRRPVPLGRPASLLCSLVSFMLKGDFVLETGIFETNFVHVLVGMSVSALTVSSYWIRTKSSPKEAQLSSCSWKTWHLQLCHRQSLLSALQILEPSRLHIFDGGACVCPSRL